MSTRPQEDFADLGLQDDDHTPDMRTAPVIPDARTPGERRSDYPPLNRSHHHDNQQF